MGKVDLDAENYLQHKVNASDLRFIAALYGCALTIMKFAVAVEVLHERIDARKNDVSDTDLAVVDDKLKQWKALHNDQLSDVVIINTDKKLDIVILTSAM